MPALLACWMIVLATVQAQDVRVIPPSGQWVTDQVGLLSRGEQQTLSRRLAAYADTTSTQIVVVILESLGGIPASEYAIALGRRWAVGQQGQNNGVVILVSAGDREVFIATGYGLEASIPDAVASRVYRNVVVPAFREGRYFDGLYRATDALIEAARGEFEAIPEDPGDSGAQLALVVVLLVILIFVVVAVTSSHRTGGGQSPPQRRRRSAYGGPPIIIWGSPGHRHGGGGFGGFGGGMGGGFGGFGGGGGSFGGGGAGGGW
jgi:uncharacterized protein